MVIYLMKQEINENEESVKDCIERSEDAIKAKQKACEEERPGGYLSIQESIIVVKQWVLLVFWWP